jgi:hypothetical protein
MVISPGEKVDKKGRVNTHFLRGAIFRRSLPKWSNQGIAVSSSTYELKICHSRDSSALAQIAV